MMNRNLLGLMSRLMILATILVGFGLRLYRLGAESLWYDETVSVVLAKKSISTMIAHTAGDIHPPGYYLLLHLWDNLARPDLAHGLEFLFAWPSLFFGLLIVVLLYPIGQRLHGPRIGLLAIFLAAINPFHLWYSQEVRMYTVGGMLGLVCLWALLNYWGSAFFALANQASNAEEGNSSRRQPLLQSRSDRIWLAIYIIAAAAGLYILYYFAFTLIGLNLIALIGWIRLLRSAPANCLGPAEGMESPIQPSTWRATDGQPSAGGKAVGWSVAQIGVLLLWSPWLPTFWRQATDPPVPSWRMGWSWLGFRSDLVESFSALLAGQSIAPNLHLLSSGLSLVILVVYGAYLLRLRPFNRFDADPGVLLLIYVLAPLLTIFLLTALVTPLYHVRYLFISAPPLMIMTAAVLVWLSRWQRWLGGVVMVMLLLLNGQGLYRFWFNPDYRADDHRSAVSHLANRWRPGDLILVNAGWAYPLLQVYWPTLNPAHTLGEAPRAEPLAPIPPPLVGPVRLIDALAIGQIQKGALEINNVKSNNVETGTLETGKEQPLLRPLVVVGGSVDGADSLGWGNPESDFFAISQQEAVDALTSLATCTWRIWHYRIYDTVSDPAGTIRGWLEEKATLLSDDWISGRDLGRLQLYEITSPATEPSCQMIPLPWTATDFGQALRLQAVVAPETQNAGTILYATLAWLPLPELAAQPAPLSMSLRLYAGQDQQIAQQDESPLLSTQEWRVNQVQRQSLALPIPAQTPPGRYTLELIVYRQSDGAPLPLPEAPNTTWGQRLTLTSIEITTVK